MLILNILILLCSILRSILNYTRSKKKNYIINYIIALLSRENSSWTRLYRFVLRHGFSLLQESAFWGSAGCGKVSWRHESRIWPVLDWEICGCWFKVYIFIALREKSSRVCVKTLSPTHLFLYTISVLGSIPSVCAAKKWRQNTKYLFDIIF
jgi:hypothetical protein